MVVPDNIISTIRSGYPRPLRLSDPYRDFSPEELDTIIRKRDADLTDMDLRNVFQSILPAGEYSECIYFLPLALERILQPKGDYDLCCDVLSWIGDNADGLKADGLWEKLLSLLEGVFAELTASFILDDNGHPEGCTMVDALIKGLNNPRGGFDGMGDKLLKKYLGAADSYPHAAWLVWSLYYFFYVIDGNSMYLQDVAVDHALLRKAGDIILDRAMENDALLDFWDRKLNRCGIL